MMKNTCCILAILTVLLISAHSQSSTSRTISASLKYISSGMITPDTSISYNTTVPLTWNPLNFIIPYPNGIQNQGPYTILMSVVDLRIVPSSNRIHFKKTRTITNTSFTLNLYSSFANLIKRISYRYVIIASPYTGNGNFYMSALIFNYNGYLSNFANITTHELTTPINTSNTFKTLCFINGMDINATSSNLISIMITAPVISSTIAYLYIRSPTTSISYNYLATLEFDFIAYNDVYYNRANFAKYQFGIMQSANVTSPMTYSSANDYTGVTAIGVFSINVQGDNFLDFNISLVNNNSISISSNNTANIVKSFSVVYFTMMTYYCATSTPFFYALNSICYDYCIVRTYTDPSSLSCIACPYDCYTCNASSCFTCNQANDFRVLDNTTARCVPLAGYFQNSTTVCPRCTINCTKCLNLTYCQMCIPGMYLTNGICSTCPTGCSTCISNAQCQSCSSGYTLTKNYMCYSTCPASQYFNTTTFSCSPCPNNCMSCVSSSSCSSCPSKNYISNELCYSCPNLCETCLSSYYCYTCQNGSYLRSDQLCYSNCEVRTYADSSRKCLACPYDCYTCNVNGLCTSCSSIDRRVINPSTSRCVADKGYYDNLTAICVACPNGCSTCLPNLVCSSCSTEYFLSNGQCVSCPSNCKTCLSSFYCQSCKNNNYLNLNTNICVANCPSGYFADNSTSICSNCSGVCLTCMNATNNCTSCTAGKYLSGTTCTNCPNACTTCSSSQSCQSCEAGYQKNNAGICVAQCPQGQYRNNNAQTLECASCNSSCLRCINNSGCTACYPGYYLNNSACNSCPTGQYLNPNMSCSTNCSVRYYADTRFNTCQPCPYDCYTCDNTTKCTSCNLTTEYRTLNNQTSRCVPIAGYFDNSVTVSVSCSSNCLVCSSSIACSQCNSSYYLENSMCLACPQDCGSCMTSLYCSTCKNGFYLRPDNLCYNTCLSRTYLFENKICINCLYTCFTCNSNLNCLSCSASDFRVLSNNSCVPMDGYYDNLISTCAKCPDGCAICQSFTKCSACKQQFYLNNTSCLACASNCKICFNGNTCDTCNSQFSLNSGTCKVSQGTQSSSSSMPIGIMAGFVTGGLVGIVCFFIYRKCQKEPKPILIYKGEEPMGSSGNIIIADEENGSAENEWYSRSRPISSQQDCSICLLQQTFFRTRCGHHFHVVCILVWLSKRDNCPNCRQLLSKQKYKIYCRQCRMKQKVLRLDKLKEIAAEKKEESETICDECKQVPI